MIVRAWLLLISVVVFGGPLSAAELPNGYTAGSLKLAGAELHYRKGGSGPALILLHGFPEDGSAYAHVMPALARNFTVVVPDMRGIGRSVALVPAFDAEILAGDIQQLAVSLQLERPYVVGHDTGGTVAHAMGRLYHQRLRGVMLIESPLPGLQPWDQIAADPAVWHINFQQAPIAETLITGRLEEYFRAQFFDEGLVKKDAVDARQLRQYAAAYTTPAQLRAGLGQYRAIPANAKFNAAHKEVIAIPLTLIGGESGIGRGMEPMVKDLRAHGWSNVTLKILPGGHYLMDESPRDVIAAIEQHAR